MSAQQIQTPVDYVRKLIEANDLASLTALIDSMHAQEIVHTIGHLSLADQTKLMTMLSSEDAAEVFEEIPDAQAAEIAEAMDVADVAAILDKMQSDEQADLIQELDEEDASAILDQMHPDEAEDVRRRIRYAPDSAGGIMVTEFLLYDASQTVNDVVEHLRAHSGALENYHLRHVYLKSASGEFFGFLQMRHLVLAGHDTQLSAVAITEVLTVKPDTTLDTLSGFFDTYDYYSVPVIDVDGRMCGVVLRKDVFEAVAERVTFEHLETQGIVGGDELRTMPVILRSRRRLSWLSVNILLNIIAASVIAYHQDVLSSVIALAVFLPIISDMSGCSGNQAVAVSMRELSIGTVRPTEVMRVWFQELSVGVINGLILGILIGMAAYFWKGNIFLGIVAGGALALNTVAAVSIGGTVPLLLKKFGVDPALASGPILTTITDMFGFFLALTFASMMLPQLTGL